MNPRFTYVAITTLALGGIAFTGCKEEPSNSSVTGSNAAPATQPTVGDKVGAALATGINNTTQPVKNAADTIVAGVTPTGANTIDSTRAVVVTIVEDALSRNNYGDMVGHFTKSDAQRVTNGKPDSKDLDDLADAVANAYKGKYGEKFSISDKDKTFGPDFLQLATAPSASDGTSADVNAKQATGKIAASHGYPELNLLFISEDGKWRLDIPDTADAQKLHDNLLRALTDLQQGSSAWPDNKVEAQRAITHRILLAVEDKM